VRCQEAVLHLRQLMAGRANAEFKLAAAKESSDARQQGKFRADNQGPLLAGSVSTSAHQEADLPRARHDRRLPVNAGRPNRHAWRAGEIIRRQQRQRAARVGQGHKPGTEGERRSDEEVPGREARRREHGQRKLSALGSLQGGRNTWASARKAPPVTSGQLRRRRAIKPTTPRPASSIA